ncbi:MAG TPA: response regulator transcription factor [Thermoanaerobaculia bacterium]|nr:response regulator transcription factor [Thermoanaerobaculia bacterium]
MALVVARARSMPARISVAMISDNRLFAEAMAISLARADGIDLVAWSAPNASGEPRLDVALVDASEGRAPALARLAQLEGALPDARAIVLGVESEDESVLDFIEAGAAGYVLRSATPADLLAAIRTAMAGEARCSPRVAAEAVARVAHLARQRPPEPPQIGEPLTEREREVLVQIARGLGNKEIGRALAITVRTVKNHVHSVLAKLRVHRRRDAVLLGHQLGLLSFGGAALEPPGGWADRHSSSA